MKPRNYKFLQKFMVLMQYSFDNWEPDQVTYKGEIVAKEFNRFRKDITIMAGHHYTTFDFNGNVHLHAKSIAFGSMEEEDFEKLYSAVIDVILKKVLTNYSREDLDEVVRNILSFT